MIISRVEGTTAGSQHQATGAEAATEQSKTKRTQKVHWAEQQDGQGTAGNNQANQSPDSPSLKSMYKNCSKAVIERDRQLRALHQILEEENIMQRHIDL
jgi:hypothetical protein